jgi:hypothetical protein
MIKKIKYLKYKHYKTFENQQNIEIRSQLEEQYLTLCEKHYRIIDIDAYWNPM